MTNKKSLRKIITASLSAIFALSMSSCGISTSNSQVVPAEKNPTVSQEPTIGSSYLTAEQWLDTLEIKDYNGYEFTIATTDSEVFLPEGDGLVQQAVNKRNDWVQSKYNISLVTKKYTESEFYSALRSAYLSQSFIPDLYHAPISELSKFVSENLLFNLNSLPFFDLHSDYVNQDLLKASTGNNTTYIILDSASQYHGSQWCVFYDIGLLNELGLDDPANLVKSGEWTWEKLLEMASQVNTLGSDYHGFLSYVDKESLSYAVWASSGMKFLGDTYKQYLSLNLDFEIAENVLNTTKSVYTSEVYGKHIKETATDLFKKGKSLFFIYKLDFASAIAENQREWSIVPLPKINTTQENYYSVLDTTAKGIAVPNSLPDSERTGTIVNGMFAASYEHIDESLKNSYVYFYLRNNSSAVMLSKILDSTHLDFAFVYGNGISALSNNTYKMMYTILTKGYDLQTTYTRKDVESVLTKEVNKYFK